MHSETVQVCVGELAVGALVHLHQGRDRNPEREKGRKKRNRLTEGEMGAVSSQGLLEEELQIRRKTGPPSLEQADPSDHILLCNIEHH